MTAAVDTLPGGPRTSDLLLAFDQTRPRSQQVELGWSELGCRRRVGYRLAGTKPTNPGGSVQAVMGTAIDEAVNSIVRQLDSGEFAAQRRVEFAGIPGTLDRYHEPTRTVVDVKTTSSRWLEHIQQHGPSREHLWQISAYAAALVTEGVPVRWVRLDYLARDTGEEWTWVGRFNPQHVRDALAWLKTVRDTELDMLPRDYAPDSAFCRHCPFLRTCWQLDTIPEGRDPRVVLFREDPDAAGWAERLWQAKRDKEDAEQREDEAKGALDAVRPNLPDKTVTVDVGWRLPLVWQVTRPERVDQKAVKAEYAAAGAKPPMQPPKEQVSLKFGKPVAVVPDA